MDAFCVVRALQSAIYGQILLVQHVASGRYFAMKMMSLAHMRAHRAVTGPRVLEDGFLELNILRMLSADRVSRSALTVGSKRGACHGNQSDEVDEHSSRDGETVEIPEASSVNARWLETSERGAVLEQSADQEHLLTLHLDFIDPSTSMRCLVFDYCPYGDLYSHVAAQAHTGPEGGPRGLPLETARLFFSQIAHAVRFLHVRGVAHRDLSLENVLLDAYRRCRLADFGLARLEGSRCSGPRVGKVLYMAPEVFSRSQFRADTATEMVAANNDAEECYNGLQADIWSLGVLLFILVTGIPPFKRASEEDARFGAVTNPDGRGLDSLLRAWHLDNYVSLELRALLGWMLCVAPDGRPTAEQVCEHNWLRTAEQQQQPSPPMARSGGRGWSGHEPEEEGEGESLGGKEPQMELEGETDCGWTSPRSKKRVKRTV